MTRSAALLIGLFLLGGCAGTTGHGGEQPLVRVGDFVLNIYDIPPAVYAGKKGQDSILAVRQFINNWVEEHIFLYFALQNTDTARINRLTESYRNALLRDMYETRLRELGMDSVQVSRQELLDYYQQQKDNFRATDTFIRWRYLIVDAGNPKRYRYRSWFYSTREEDLRKLETAYKDLIALQPDTSQWIPAHEARKIFPGLRLHKPQGQTKSFRIQKTRDKRLYLVEIIRVVYPDDVLPFELTADRVRFFLKQRKWESHLKELRRKMVHEAQQQKLIKYYADE